MAERKKDNLMIIGCRFMVYSYKYLVSFFIIDKADLFLQRKTFNILTINFT